MKQILCLVFCSVFLLANGAALEGNTSSINATPSEVQSEANNTNPTDDTMQNFIEIKKHAPLVKNHPYIVHFSVAFCVVILIVSLLNILAYKQLTFVDYTLLLITVGLFVVSFMTGESSYEVVQSHINSQEVRDSLMLHKRMGFLLLVGVGVLFVWRNVLFIFKGRVPHIVYFVLLIAFILMSLLQGYQGVGLVFTNGIGVYYDGLMD